MQSENLKGRVGTSQKYGENELEKKKRIFLRGTVSLGQKGQKIVIDWNQT